MTNIRYATTVAPGILNILLRLHQNKKNQLCNDLFSKPLTVIYFISGIIHDVKITSS